MKHLTILISCLGVLALLGCGDVDRAPARLSRPGPHTTIYIGTDAGFPGLRVDTGLDASQEDLGIPVEDGGLAADSGTDASTIEDAGLLCDGVSCPVDAPLCMEGECVGCTENADCHGSTPFCGDKNTCVVCVDDLGCGGSTPLCHGLNIIVPDFVPLCVECMTGDDCEPLEGCSDHTCVAAECNRDLDCMDNGDVCVGHECMRAECFSIQHCPRGEACYDHQCAVPDTCMDTSDCPSPQRCFGGLCIDHECGGDLVCGGGYSVCEWSHEDGLFSCVE